MIRAEYAQLLVAGPVVGDGSVEGKLREGIGELLLSRTWHIFDHRAVVGTPIDLKFTARRIRLTL